jgi:hypothetical protein
MKLSTNLTSFSDCPFFSLVRHSTEYERKQVRIVCITLNHSSVCRYTYTYPVRWLRVLDEAKVD